MRTAGLDVGSRTVKLVVLEDGRVVESCVRQDAHDPLAAAGKLVDRLSRDGLVVTGYGRHLLTRHLQTPVVTEIRAVARGVYHLRPEAAVVLDIGGQDTKAISLDGRGGVRKFEMNDKCAAGTGRFLEMMAVALGCSLEEFIREAGEASEGFKLSSMCAVFSESEVISLVHRGVPRPTIARGVHEAVARRAAGLVRRLGVRGPLAFTGGVALNAAAREGLGKELGCEVLPLATPQTVAALGCALIAAETASLPDSNG
jgi:(R)-2-hydroxyacyl-CoA dehydratese activating ATPase